MDLQREVLVNWGGSKMAEGRGVMGEGGGGRGDNN